MAININVTKGNMPPALTGKLTGYVRNSDGITAMAN
jgi:hypothetical protein